MIHALEQSARERGFACVYIQVQADKNPRAVELYKRLGYQTVRTKPYRDFFHQVDEHGNVREGTEVIVDMRKKL
jgi:ribosomal protein S18 acetylase RimI-like enzyme